jgi:hypothetical protein
VNDSRGSSRGQGVREGLSRPFTLVRFRILPPLYELHSQTVAVPLDAGTGLLHVEIVDSCIPSSFETASGRTSSIPGDEVGVTHNSMVEVALPGLMSMQPPRRLESGNVPEGQLYALRALNHVIQHYRVLAAVPQIRPVTVTDGRGFRFTYFNEDGSTKTGVITGRNALPTEGQPADVPSPSAQVAEAIRRASEAGPPALWTTLKADAFADLDAGDVHSGLAHLYMSFEVLAHQTLRHLKDEGTDTDGAPEGSLRPANESPSIRTVVDRCFALFSGGYSQTRIGELTTGLLRYRDEILRGYDIAPTPKAVDEALACYLELKDWLVAALSSEA